MCYTRCVCARLFKSELHHLRLYRNPFATQTVSLLLRSAGARRLLLLRLFGEALYNFAIYSIQHDASRWSCTGHACCHSADELCVQLSNPRRSGGHGLRVLITSGWDFQRMVPANCSKFFARHQVGNGKFPETFTEGTTLIALTYL